MENNIISNKVIYEAEFKSTVDEDYDTGSLILSDNNSYFRIIDDVWDGDAQTLGRDKKYKVTLKIEEVE